MRSGLNQLRVVHHCPMSWSQMSGDDRVRRCSHCERSVYNVADLPAAEAEAVILRGEGQGSACCFQRRDGTIVARQCRPYPRSVFKILGGLAGAAALVLAVIPVLAQGESINPQSKSDSLIEQNRYLSERLRTEKDLAKRQVLQRERERIRESFRNNVGRLKASDA